MFAFTLYSEPKAFNFKFTYAWEIGQTSTDFSIGH